MYSVVINLLTNALKFSKATDVIEVKIELSQIDMNGEVDLRIEVKDQGIGIAVHEQELIF
jgi:signal transduction histidine kinase